MQRQNFIALYITSKQKISRSVSFFLKLMDFSEEKMLKFLENAIYLKFKLCFHLEGCRPNPRKGTYSISIAVASSPPKNSFYAADICNLNLIQHIFFSIVFETLDPCEPHFPFSYYFENKILINFIGLCIPLIFSYLYLSWNSHGFICAEKVGNIENVRPPRIRKNCCRKMMLFLKGSSFRNNF